MSKKHKRLTLLEKKKLHKQGICWKCNGKLQSKKQLVCDNCKAEHDGNTAK